MIDSVRSIIESVDKSQNAAAKRRALGGGVQAVAHVWHEKMLEVYPDTMQPSAYTGRDFGHIKDMIKRYGAQETVTLVEWAIENWKRLGNLPYMMLPPMPVLYNFYAQRERIIAAWEESKRIAARPELTIPERPVDSSGAVQKSLVELLLEKRRERASKTGFGEG